MKAVCLAAMVGATNLSALNPGETAVVETWSLHRFSPVFDGQWQGITAASDGRCYFVASTHAPDRGAALFRFDAKTRQLEMLAEDLTLATGRDPTASVPQGKVHSALVEDGGWLYFATHLANYWEEAIEHYPGAHVLGYHMESGEFRDFGVIRPGFSIYSAIGLDPERQKLYVFSVPFRAEDVEKDGCHLYRIDIPSGEIEHLGQVVEQGRKASFWMFVDAEGDCWFSIWGDGGNLFQVKAGSGEIIRHDKVLPGPLQSPDGTRPEERRASRLSWTWATPLPGRKEALFTMGLTGGNDERLWRFDPSKPLEYGQAFTPVGWIGATFLSVALGGDRVYFVQYRDPADARRFMPEGVRDRRPEEVDFDAVLHLRSISIAPDSDGKVKDHGPLVDAQGRKALMVEALAADGAGNVFMTGSWSVANPEEGSMQYVWPGQRFWRDLEPGKFHRMRRGEFFSLVPAPEN